MGKTPGALLGSSLVVLFFLLSASSIDTCWDFREHRGPVEPPDPEAIAEQGHGVDDPSDDDRMLQGVQPSSEARGGQTPKPFRARTDAKYLIIAPDAFRDELQPLVDWKTRKGVPTDIVTVEEIDSAYTSPGMALNQKVHAFLRNYNTDYIEMDWVLLMGDNDEVPTAMLWTNGSQWNSLADDLYPSDSYYAGLTYDWDSDGDGVLGEPGEVDYIWNAFVGRIPVDTEEQCEMAVKRIIDYETQPASGDWTDSALIASGTLWPPNDDNTDPNDDTPEPYEPWEDNTYELTQRILPYFQGNVSVTLLNDYPYSEGGHYSYATDTLNGVNFLSEIEDGRSLVSIASHGWVSSNGTAHYAGDGVKFNGQWEPFLYYDTAAALHNDPMLPFMYISGCNVGDFTETDDTNFEQLFLNPDGGVIGLISPTDFSYRGEFSDDSSWGNFWMAERFWYRFFDLGENQPGRAFYKMRLDYYNYLQTNLYMNEIERHINLAAYNLMGDPEVPVWTDVPSTFHVSVSDTYLHTDRVTVSVRDPEGRPVEGATVCLQHPSLYEVMVTDISGNATFSSTFTMVADLNITVTGKNFIPHLETRPVVVEPADLSVSTSGISISEITSIAGDTVHVEAIIFNEGKTNASNIVVSFHLGDPEDPSALMGANATMGAIPFGTSSKASVPWKAVGGLHTIHVKVDPLNTVPESDEANNMASKDFDIRGPDLFINNWSITFEPQLPLPIGEQVVATIEVKNKGTTPVQDFAMYINAGNSSVSQLISHITSFGEVPAFGERFVQLPFTLNHSYTYLLFQADPLDAISEINETNNHAWLAIRPLHPPRLELPTLIFEEDAGVKSLHLADHVLDPDTPADDLDFNITPSGPEVGRVQLVHGNILEINTSKDYFGDFFIPILVSDGDFLPRTFALKVTVTPVNDPPELQSLLVNGVAQSGYEIGILEDTKYMISLHAQDVEDDQVLFSDSTELFDIDARSGNISWMPTNQDVGHHSIVIGLSDGNLSTEITLVIDVLNTNDPPLLDDIGDMVATVGKLFQFTLGATDIDVGDTLIYSVNFISGATLFSVDPLTGEIEFTPRKADRGEYTIEFKVEDGSGANNTKKVTMVIEGDTSQDDNTALALVGLVIIIFLLIIYQLVGRTIPKLDSKEDWSTEKRREVREVKKKKVVKKAESPPREKVEKKRLVDDLKRR